MKASITTSIQLPPQNVFSSQVEESNSSCLTTKASQHICWQTRSQTRRMTQSKTRFFPFYGTFLTNKRQRMQCL
ncbi:hypothetical protein VNO78_02793 [Psophocarpus tetragonolobus]|uniref:Uncharacterized protein n=1 Tax=Psophocarpus tetragonolobus TaxID=3891 RepID=A0AAN9XV10_PSOTE